MRPAAIAIWAGRGLLGAALGLAAFGLLCHLTGLRINTTRSIPPGIYRLTDAPVGKGEYVIFCPPQTALFDEARERGYIGAGFCPGDFGLMMKQVAGVAGDVVASTEKGIAVNGKRLPASAPRETDKGGRPLPRQEWADYVLGESELLLMSDASPTSFDARYFGPVNVAQVRGVVRPVIIF